MDEQQKQTDQPASGSPLPRVGPSRLGVIVMAILLVLVIVFAVLFSLLVGPASPMGG